MRHSAVISRLWVLLLVLVAWSWPTDAAATTGGDEPLEVLGYAPGDEKIYLLREIDDGSEALPQLFYVMVDGPRAGKVIEVRSWHRAVEQADWDDAAVERFHQKLARLRKRLRPVKTIAPTHTATVDVRTKTVVTDPWSPEWSHQYSLELSIPHPTAPGVATSRTVTAYDPDIEVVAELRVPGKAVAVLLVRYFSSPYEHGYTRDIALGVPLTTAQIVDGETAPAVTYDPWKRFDRLTDGR